MKEIVPQVYASLSLRTAGCGLIVKASITPIGGPLLLPAATPACTYAPTVSQVNTEITTIFLYILAIKAKVKSACVSVLVIHKMYYY